MSDPHGPIEKTINPNQAFDLTFVGEQKSGKPGPTGPVTFTFDPPLNLLRAVFSPDGTKATIESATGELGREESLVTASAQADPTGNLPLILVAVRHMGVTVVAPLDDHAEMIDSDVFDLIPEPTTPAAPAS